MSHIRDLMLSVVCHNDNCHYDRQQITSNLWYKTHQIPYTYMGHVGVHWEMDVTVTFSRALLVAHHLCCPFEVVGLLNHSGSPTVCVVVDLDPSLTATWLDSSRVPLRIAFHLCFAEELVNNPRSSLWKMIEIPTNNVSPQSTVVYPESTLVVKKIPNIGLDQQIRQVAKPVGRIISHPTNRHIATKLKTV